MLIRLRGSAGWSAPLLFANPEDRFCEANAGHFIIFSPTILNKCNNTRSRMLDFIYHMTYFEISFLRKNINILSLCTATFFMDIITFLENQ